MKTKEETIKFNEKSFKSHKDYSSDMHPTLFFPKSDDVKGFIAEAIAMKDKCVEFFGTNHIWEVVNRIVMSEYKGDGKDINIQYLFDAVMDVAKIWEQVVFLKNVGELNRGSYEKVLEFVKCQSDDETLIGVGVLSEDYKDGDSDCYETAGGYRGWKALKGTLVEYHLNKDLTISLKFDSNCEIDHYNNNLYGNSTGNGLGKKQIFKQSLKR
jgi:hypothetical protein